MSRQSIVVTDADRNLDLTDCELRAPGGMGSLKAFRLRGGTSEGLRVVQIDNGALSLMLLPTRGMGVWRGAYGQTPLEWRSPVARPVHPQFVNLHDRNGLGWLNGFNELMCRCGLAFNGPPGRDGGDDLTLHGRIANLPAHRLEFQIDADDAGAMSVCGVVDETTMFGPSFRLTSTVTTTRGSNRVEFIDEITNLGSQPVDLSLLYHVNVGRPFLEDGGGIALPVRELAPRDPRAAEGVATYAEYGPPESQFAEQAYYVRPVGDDEGWSTAMLHNREKTLGFVVSFRVDQLPYFTLWKNTGAEQDGYVTGLEPGLNLPNFRAFEREQNRLVSLGPGKTYTASMAWEIYDSVDGVAAVLHHIEQLQKRAIPIVHKRPQPEWSPAGQAETSADV